MLFCVKKTECSFYSPLFRYTGTAKEHTRKMLINDQSFLLRTFPGLTVHKKVLEYTVVFAHLEIKIFFFLVLVDILQVISRA